MQEHMLYKVRIFKDDEYVTEITTIELLDTAHENIDVFLKAVRDALEDRGLLTVEHRDQLLIYWILAQSVLFVSMLVVWKGKSFHWHCRHLTEVSQILTKKADPLRSASLKFNVLLAS